MRKYNSYAPCGFCEHHGRVFTDYNEDFCRKCEIRRIRDALETLGHAVLWEHDHKYRADDEEEVRNCTHCKHALTPNDRYHSAEYADHVSCSLDGDKLDENDFYPTRSALSRCEFWERAVDLSKGDSDHDHA
jgi:hypothetical protein